MVRKPLTISITDKLLNEPILYRLVKDFDLSPNVRRADVTSNEAWLILELQGESEEHIQKGIDYLTSIGASVKTVQGDFIDG